MQPLLHNLLFSVFYIFKCKWLSLVLNYNILTNSLICLTFNGKIHLTYRVCQLPRYYIYKLLNHVVSMRSKSPLQKRPEIRKTNKSIRDINRSIKFKSLKLASGLRRSSLKSSVVHLKGATWWQAGAPSIYHRGTRVKRSKSSCFEVEQHENKGYLIDEYRDDGWLAFSHPQHTNIIYFDMNAYMHMHS